MRKKSKSTRLTPEQAIAKKQADPQYWVKYRKKKAHKDLQLDLYISRWLRHEAARERADAEAKAQEEVKTAQIHPPPEKPS